MSESQKIVDCLQKTIDCIDEYTIFSERDGNAEEACNKLIADIIIKLHSKNIKLSDIDKHFHENTIDERKALEQIMNQMIEYAELNFSNQLEISGENDMINTIATTVNILGEELESKISEIRHSLHEKDVLLQEVHHRVKNNLQMISSLIGLQMKRSRSKEVVEQLTESQNRVKAIALIHEKLYLNDNISNVNISEYTLNLISFITSMYDDNRRLITIKHEIEDNIRLDIGRSIPYGLMLNEIISNCYKHAFKDGEKGSIFISLSTTDTSIRLKVKDSGCGMNTNINLKTIKSLGLKLITSLSAQLKAKLSFENKDGLAIYTDIIK